MSENGERDSRCKACDICAAPPKEDVGVCPLAEGWVAPTRTNIFATIGAHICAVAKACVPEPKPKIESGEEFNRRGKGICETCPSWFKDDPQPDQPVKNMNENHEVVIDVWGACRNQGQRGRWAGRKNGERTLSRESCYLQPQRKEKIKRDQIRLAEWRRRRSWFCKTGDAIRQIGG